MVAILRRRRTMVGNGVANSSREFLSFVVHLGDSNVPNPVVFNDN